MAEPTPACKKPRHSLLPDIETMEVQRSADKQSICAVKSGYEQMKAISLELTSVKRREKMNDDIKVLWLMAKYGVSAVIKVIAAIEAVPSSLSERQALKYVHKTVDENEVARSDVETMYSFLVHSCLSITRIGANSKVERVVIAPPCGECYSCKRPLVSYLTTDVKLYTCVGLKPIEKVILRCKECNLIYNPTQFGNKHTQGFQFYEKEQPILEVSDTVYFERSLLEWQCCLA